MLARPPALALAVALLVGAGAGCEDKQLAQLDVVKREACACKTPACAQAAMGKLPAGEIHSDHRSQTLARELMDCIAKLDADAAAAANDKAEDPDAPAGSAGSAGSGSGSATRP